MLSYDCFVPKFLPVYFTYVNYMYVYIQCTNAIGVITNGLGDHATRSYWSTRGSLASSGMSFEI